jgi:hypothetical protein
VEGEHGETREEDLCPVRDHDGNDGDDHGQHEQYDDANHRITTTRRSPARPCRSLLLGKTVRLTHKLGLRTRLILQVRAVQI